MRERERERERERGGERERVITGKMRNKRENARTGKELLLLLLLAITER
jgi:hypothetical protein